MSEFDYILKFIVIGDTGVGKSSIVTQFMQQKMTTSHQVTLGVQFASKIIQMLGKTIKLQIWDTAGQQNFRSITRSYYRSAIGALLIYDITKRKSYEHLKEWIKEIRGNGSQNIQVLLIGNKNDLEEQREVSAGQGRKFAEENGLQWMEISAREYPRVQDTFVKLARLIVGRIEKGEVNEDTPGVKISRGSRIDPVGDSNLSKGRCC